MTSSSQPRPDDHSEGDDQRDPHKNKKHPQKFVAALLLATPRIRKVCRHHRIASSVDHPHRLSHLIALRTPVRLSCVAGAGRPSFLFISDAVTAPLRPLKNVGDHLDVLRRLLADQLSPPRWLTQLRTHRRYKPYPDLVACSIQFQAKSHQQFSWHA